MEDFNRTYTPIDFGENDNSPIEIVLKFKDDFEGTWERNENNTLRFGQVKHLLAQTRRCYFQKIKTYERVDQYGITHNNSVHKILIPIEKEKAIELQCKINDEPISQFDKAYSYFVQKAKEVVFIIAPNKDVEQCDCFFSFYSKEKKGAGKQFTDFYQKVDALNIPTVDINKGKDKQIWDNYVNALKKLVKQKENVWKIQKVSQAYTDNIRGERATYVDITISEDDLNKKFEEEIEELFSPSELNDYAVNKNTAFIEFDTYRILSQDEISQLNAIASEYFFELSQELPSNTISGELSFKYTDDDSKEEIYSNIQQKLSEEYGYDDLQITPQGEIIISEIDYPHVKKCIEDNFSSIAFVEQRNEIELKIKVKTPKNTLPADEFVKKRLDSSGLGKARAYKSNERSQLVIDVSAPVKYDLFSDCGLQLNKRIYRFGNNNNRNSFVEIAGFEIIDGEYQTSNKIDNFKDSLVELQNKNEDLTIRQLPTRYIFGYPQENENQIQVLREVKTKTDLLGKSTVNIRKATVVISADSASDYQCQIQRIKDAVPDIELEDKPYKTSYYLCLNTDMEDGRKSIITDIQNNIRKENLNVEYDPYKKYTRVSFSYNFDSEEERDCFKEKFVEVCDKYNNYLKLSFENELGRTTYEFHKNESLEIEKEKETAKGVSSATFVFLTKEQYETLKQKIKEDGDNAYFRDGIQIGILISKGKNKLQFKITKDFDDYLIESSDNIRRIIAGYIKPIFPGELSNIGRMIRAMAKVTRPGSGRVGYPANNNLPNFLFDPTLARISSQDLEEEKKRILLNLNEPLLANQPKQLEAVAKSLIATDMALIQGPPGTGKTTVIAEIIWQTLLRNPESKILVTSQTNLAVDNALERLRGKKMVRPIRIGNIDKFEDEGKMYSNERMQQWLAAKANSQEEKSNKDNAINDWINNISRRCSQENTYSDIIEKWKKGLDCQQSFLKPLFSSEYFKYVNVFAATCSECGSKNFASAYQSMFQKNQEIQGDPVFDVVIMDEASKATPPELVLPLTLGKKVIIIGDHKQLPPMLDEKEFGEALEAIGAKDLIENWTKQDYKTSQFEKLFVNAPKSIVASLDTQFRMHEQIMNCISQFYKDQEELENGLLCGIRNHMDVPDFTDKASRWHGFTILPFIEPKFHAIWVNVETAEKKVGTSYENQGEIDAIKTVLSALTKANGFKEYMDSFQKDDDKEIGVITYYMPQMDKIRKTLYPDFRKDEWRNFEQHKYENEFQIPFRINTVDRFQGMERNIIIISTVRSNIQIDEKGKEQKNNYYPFALGFARELQRVNVGFSRAKRLLIVVGNEKHFANKPEYAEAISKMHRVDVKQLKNL
ncbi:MAG: AAA domain-containing protein [Bacteroidales bacterium]|nr:AAA domain-containing protein [Bacteroidales bacterium]